MTKSKRRKRHGERTGTPHRPRPLRVAALTAIVAVAVGLAWTSWRRDRRPVAAGPAGGDAPSATLSATTAPAAAAPSVTATDTPAHFRPLLGEWLRPDGGYVLSVTGVSPDGRAAVTYLNPRPIRVAQAEARREGDIVGLFVKFDDVGYPGSTYSLGYDAASGELKGRYYQAAQRQQYEVVFVRRR